MVRGKQIELPTADQLYLAMCVPDALDLPQSEFTTLLRLLAACDGIRIFRRHIFLPNA